MLLVLEVSCTAHFVIKHCFHGTVDDQVAGGTGEAPH